MKMWQINPKVKWLPLKNWFKCKRYGHDLMYTVKAVILIPTETCLCRRCYKRVPNPHYKFIPVTKENVWHHRL